MVVTEMEVYAVSGADGKKRHRPWRKCSDFSDEYIKLLTEELAPLRPPNGSDVTNFCLLLIGPISGGKSSFINAVLSAFAGKVIQKVAVGESEQGVTKRYVPYQVRQADGSLLRLHLCDTPGLGESSGMDAINLHFLLDGHLPHWYEFSPYRHVSLRSVGFISKPTLAQEIHSVALVLDTSTVSDLSPTIKCMINDCKRLILEKGIQLVVILTKIDKLHKDIADDLADVFKHQVVNAAVEKVSEMLGIPPNNVFPVKNYHSEVETEVAVHAFALMALRKLICMASDVLEERTNDSDDRTAGSGEVKESDTA
ncbi:interferon-induced protein 44-like [Mya arenaria]|uniref:interferon-induced protein 44-like n=1 Tax=Mya arenaria TaxID=6604 RepID=UPI0022E933EC|nr:interferon-induced protein 44-like [Mya arenaria]XP_052786796.1 interferon-induced protein 44-like [Mya arenaria]XP_052786797.1 interferon-induced protein 44-like [Mya arenaria]